MSFHESEITVPRLASVVLHSCPTLGDSHDGSRVHPVRVGPRPPFHRRCTPVFNSARHPVWQSMRICTLVVRKWLCTPRTPLHTGTEVSFWSRSTESVDWQTARVDLPGYPGTAGSAAQCGASFGRARADRRPTRSPHCDTRQASTGTAGDRRRVTVLKQPEAARGRPGEKQWPGHKPRPVSGFPSPRVGGPPGPGPSELELHAGPGARTGTGT
eukprot:3593259-Rhodomonas_salina.1